MFDIFRPKYNDKVEKLPREKEFKCTFKEELIKVEGYKLFDINMCSCGFKFEPYKEYIVENGYISSIFIKDMQTPYEVNIGKSNLYIENRGILFYRDKETVVRYSKNKTDRCFKIIAHIDKNELNNFNNHINKQFTTKKIDILEEIDISKELNDKYIKDKKNKIDYMIKDLNEKIIDDYVSDRIEIEDILYMKFKEIGLNDILTKEIFKKILNKNYEYIDAFNREYNYKNMYSFIQYTNGLKEQGVSRDLFIYLLIQELNEGGK